MNSGENLSKILLTNHSRLIKIEEPISISLPCPIGLVRDCNAFAMEFNDEAIPDGKVQGTALAFWPDHSVKWLLCDFIVSLAPGQSIECFLKRYNLKNSYKTIMHKKEGSRIFIYSNNFEFIINMAGPLIIEQIKYNNIDIISQEGIKVVFMDENGRKHYAIIHDANFVNTGPIKYTVELYGGFGEIQDVSLNIKLNFYAGTAKVFMEIVIHNTNAAKHPEGLWDLGDSGSCLFKALSIEFQLNKKNNSPIHYKLNEKHQWQSVEGNNAIEIYQESSGRTNWNSSNHCNRDGIVPMTIPGFKVFKNGNCIGSGSSANPILFCKALSTSISLFMPYFWQEFPKSYSVHGGISEISFFPSRFPDLHELQGGEKKTHHLYIDFGAKEDTCPWGTIPIEKKIEPLPLQKSGALIDFLPKSLKESGYYNNYRRVVLDKEEGFAAKREVIDEYGWRNFGEIYADHEAVYNVENTVFISHYNNQYDPLYSFYREYLSSGQYDWKVLAEELARHLIDIDINSTEKDREEYCHGLFWHTDHYLDAGTATHRSFSRKHLKYKTSAFCGGGPGAEHCYSTGLTVHYFQTGDTRFKKAVVDLADWSYLVVSGPSTLLAVILWSKRALNGWWQNRKSKITFQATYPLSRGTGNCINANLDAHELTGEQQYLERCEQLIEGTVHPKDPIESRHLLDPENCWSYTVFMVSLAKYLEKKRELQELDRKYYFARDCLLHYANWMMENEYPYLEKKELLEYPNETWAGQELRKGLVMMQAAKFADNNTRSILIKKARFFFEAGYKELNGWKTRYLTRPLVLVLQNGWAEILRNEDIPCYHTHENASYNWGSSDHRSSLIKTIFRIFEKFNNALKKTSIQRELSWLTFRLKKY